MIATLPDLALWAIGRRRRYLVTGESMLPALAPGDLVLVDPGAYRRRAPAAGEIVLARHPFRRDLSVVKRIRRALSDGRLELSGDNPTASTDSRIWGPVRAERVVGRVVCRLLPAPRLVR